MLISDLLRHKGAAVVTIGPDQLLTDLVNRLAERHIGGLVVTENDSIVGIVSERDVVRCLHSRGELALSATIRELMTAAVITCEPDDSIDAVASTMTEMRIRHMPVVHNGELLGIVSIGDVVAARIRTLEQERIQLENYITHG
jgi:CBS domain-containing protein